MLPAVGHLLHKLQMGIGDVSFSRAFIPIKISQRFSLFRTTCLVVAEVLMSLQRDTFAIMPMQALWANTGLS